jgi:hypothetical protein
MMASNSEADSLTSLFQSIGLTEAKAKEATKSPKSAAILKDMIQKHDLGSRGVTDKQAGLIVTYAIHVSKSSEIVEDAKKELVLEGIVQGQLKSVDQVNGAFVDRWRGMPGHDSHPPSRQRLQNMYKFIRYLSTGTNTRSIVVSVSSLLTSPSQCESDDDEQDSASRLRR